MLLYMPELLMPKLKWNKMVNGFGHA